jgi:hypothetical protein
MTSRPAHRTSAVHVFAGCVCLALVGALAWAAPPVNPLPMPAYSFDEESPASLNGFVTPGSILFPAHPRPTTIVLGSALGLNSLADDLDGLSSAHANVGETDTFVVLFSVDRLTVGAALPDPGLVNAGVPYNVREQALKSQAAGDQYMSTRVFTKQGPLLLRGGTSNSGLCRNNFDEGGTDFAAEPNTHSRDNPGTASQDNVDAAADLNYATRGQPVDVYFSVTRFSPSLPTLPGNAPSGATIYFNHEPGFYPTTVYAAYLDLGLQQLDDIDAVLVFDVNTNGIYDGPDSVVFSLAPGSPSLDTLPGVSPFGAGADLFIARPQMAPLPWAPADTFGLGGPLGPQDNIDALDLRLCTDCQSILLQRLIRFVRGDWNDDGLVNLPDFVAWTGCMTGPDVAVTGGWCEWLRLDHDEDTDLADFAIFQPLFLRSN